MRRKASKWWGEFVLNPTQPSVVGSTDGVSHPRIGPSGRPSAPWPMACMRSMKLQAPRLATSHSARSTKRPRPCARAARQPAKAATPAYAPASQSTVRPPICTGGSSGGATDGERTALGLDGEVAGRPVRERPVEPERGDGHDREVGPSGGDRPQRAPRLRSSGDAMSTSAPPASSGRCVHAHRGLALAQVAVERAVAVGLARRQPPPSHRVAAARLAAGDGRRRRGGAAARRTPRGSRRRCRAPSVPRSHPRQPRPRHRRRRGASRGRAVASGPG